MEKTNKRTIYNNGGVIKDAEIVNGRQHGIITLSNRVGVKFSFATFKEGNWNGVRIRIS